MKQIANNEMYCYVNFDRTLQAVLDFFKVVKTDPAGTPPVDTNL